MAIDMTTVKAISYNNKDVVKIEDGQGNVLWQKEQVNYIYCPLPEPNHAFKINPNTLEVTPITGTTANLTGNIWTDGTNVYYSSGSTTSSTYQQKVSFSSTAITSQSNANYFTGTTTFTGQGTFANNGKIFVQDTSGKSNTKVLDVSTGTFSGQSFSGATTLNSMTATWIFRFNGTIYAQRYADGVYYLKNDTNEYQWRNIKNGSSGSSRYGGTGYWTPDGTHLFYDDTSYHVSITNLTNFTETNHYYTGLTITQPRNIFKMNNNVYAINYESSTYKFYQLDMTTLDSSTTVWTDVTSQFTIDPNLSMVGYTCDMYDSNGDTVSCWCGRGVQSSDLI